MLIGTGGEMRECCKRSIDMEVTLSTGWRMACAVTLFRTTLSIKSCGRYLLIPSLPNVLKRCISVTKCQVPPILQLIWLWLLKKLKFMLTMVIFSVSALKLRRRAGGPRSHHRTWLCVILCARPSLIHAGECHLVACRRILELQLILFLLCVHLGHRSLFSIYVSSDLKSNTKQIYIVSHNGTLTLVNALPQSD